MNSRTADILSFLFVLATFGVAAWLYPSLPEQIPTHWNAAGEIDDYSGKLWGVIVLPLAALFTWALMKIIPLISPKGFRTTEFQGVINVFQVAMVGFLSLIIHHDDSRRSEVECQCEEIITTGVFRTCH